MRLAITLLIQEFLRPRRQDPLEYLAPAAPVLTEVETFELLDQMDGDLWRHVAAVYGVSGALEHLAPRRRRPKRRWFR